LRETRQFSVTTEDLPAYKGTPDERQPKWLIGLSVELVGNSIRIDASVIETVTGRLVASEHVEGSQEEFASLQQKLARAVTAALLHNDQGTVLGAPRTPSG